MAGHRSWSAENGQVGMVERLLARNDAEVNSQDSYGRTPLWWAARNGNPEIVKQLLARDRHP